RNCVRRHVKSPMAVHGVWAGGNRMLSTIFFQFRRHPVASRNAIDVAITKENDVVLRLAEPRCRLHERIEHRLQIECRATDDLEHVARSGLLLQGFPQFAQQSRVFDGDDRLGGEVLYQLDLFIGKRPDLLSIHVDRADELALLEHWHAHQGPYACYFDEANDGVPFREVGLIGPKVRDVNNLFGVGDAMEWDSWILAQIDHGIAPQIIAVAFLALDCDRTEGATFEEQKITEGGLTDADCIRQ